MNKSTYGWVTLFLHMNLFCAWQLPDSSRRYNEVTFLTSHNSYASKNYGYRYAQQNLTITEQLALGVRGLMLDTYQVKETNEVIVCHGKIFTQLIKREAPMGLACCLSEIKEFLEKNPTEIITIFLENYVTKLDMLDALLVASGVSQYVLKPTDWDVEESNGWPTIDWMQKQNKRLVIFNSNGPSDYLFDEWTQVIENQYGTLRVKAAARERRESKLHGAKKRYLYLLNFIPSFKYDFGNSFKLINSMFLRQLIEHTYKNGLGKDNEYRNRLPNFINIDFVDQGNGLIYTNLMNEGTFLTEINHV